MMEYTIDELQEKGFTAQSWIGIKVDKYNEIDRSDAKCDAKYTFTSCNGKLYVSDDVFGSARFEVLNPLQVYFKAAKKINIHVKLDGLEFDVYNPEIILN